VLALTLLVVPAVPGHAKDRDKDRSRPNQHRKLDKALNRRAAEGGGTSRVIVVFKEGSAGTEQIGKHGSKPRRRFWLVNAQTADVPNSVLKRLADDPAVESIHEDRPTRGELNRVAVSVGASAVQTQLSIKGAGVGVAVIDSGITSWHDDLTYLGTSSVVRTKANQRVVAFADFVNGRTSTYDDNGHGSHVAGTIAGSGYDSSGARAGIAPEAHLVGLKVLDENGRGVISDVIAAFEWAIANKNAYNIRVANVSVGAAVTESYWTDPLTLAAKRAVDAGIVVVAAAGNQGRNRLGQSQYGGITAPGNAPWVITVGAYSHEGTLRRNDDVVAAYSSRGPSAIDFEAKPDVVAPGTGVVSLSDPASLLYSTKSANLLSGTRDLSYKPYLSLSGTSMAAPVVSGTIALMMQANPSLTPNMAKAILQFTAQRSDGDDALTQGAGFVNADGAVKLARYFKTAKAGDKLHLQRKWSKQINWGSQRVAGGLIRPEANAFELGTVWGAARDGDGDNIVWGTLRDSDNIVWGTISDEADNIVWGTWSDGDNIVWGTDSDNIVWGTDCGGADCDNIVWGTLRDDADNIVWGTLRDADNIVWGTLRDDADNIVWGTLRDDADNIVWGTLGDADNIVWGTSTVDEGGVEGPVLYDDPNSAPPNFNDTSFESLLEDTTSLLTNSTATVAGSTSTTTGGR
jgi:serine protease AprX